MVWLVVPVRVTEGTDTGTVTVGVGRRARGSATAMMPVVRLLTLPVLGVDTVPTTARGGLRPAAARHRGGGRARRVDHGIGTPGAHVAGAVQDEGGPRGGQH